MISITSTAITISPELIAGEIVPVSLDATGMDLPDAPRLYLAARAYPGPGWLLGACELEHGEGAGWTGSLNLATHAAARWFFGAGADESRRILLELVEESTRDSLLRLATTLRNSALLGCADGSLAPLTPGVTLADVDARIEAALAALEIPAPSDATPQPPGTAAPGTSPDFARSDHRHPADTGRVAKSGDTMTGDLTVQAALTVGSRIGGVGAESMANGDEVIAFGHHSHAEGQNTEASGVCSHAEGNGPVTSGNYSHAEGQETESSGEASHAEGVFCVASGNYSHAEGDHTAASNTVEHAEGRFNASHTGATDAAKTLHSVGCGTADDDRRNAVETMRDGKTYLLGVGSYDGTNPNASVKDLATAINEKAEASQIPAVSPETWTFVVDDGQGGTTTVTKQVAVYAAQGAGA